MHDVVSDVYIIIIIVSCTVMIYNLLITFDVIQFDLYTPSPMTVDVNVHNSFPTLFLE